MERKKSLLKYSSFCLLFCIGFACYSQQSIEFKVKFLPSTTYIEHYLSLSESLVTLNGPEKFLKNLEKDSIPNPAVLLEGLNKEVHITTGKTNSSGMIPIVWDYVRFQLGNNNKSNMEGTKIYATYLEDNIPQIDSIVKIGAPTLTKEKMPENLKKVFSEIDYPRAKLNIGESFHYTMPMFVSVDKTLIPFEVSLTYTLKSIENSYAYLSVSMDYNLLPKKFEFKITYEAEGSGIMKYDINRNYIIHSTTDTYLNLRIVQGDYTYSKQKKEHIIQNIDILN
jgi:hypothetical protein